MIIGVCLSGLAGNYLALTVHVVALWHSAKLNAELIGADLDAELHRYTKVQICVLVPFLIAALAVARGRPRGQPPRRRELCEDAALGGPLAASGHRASAYDGGTRG